MGTGRDASFGYRNDFYKYDIVNNLWSKVADLPAIPRQYSSSFVIGNKGYIVGGEAENATVFLNELWEYNPETNVWTRKADLPTVGRAAGVAMSIHGKVYYGSELIYSLGIDVVLQSVD